LGSLSALTLETMLGRLETMLETLLEALLLVVVVEEVVVGVAAIPFPFLVLR